jgi:hypothetical protein
VYVGPKTDVSSLRTDESVQPISAAFEKEYAKSVTVQQEVSLANPLAGRAPRTQYTDIDRTLASGSQERSLVTAQTTARESGKNVDATRSSTEYALPTYYRGGSFVASQGVVDAAGTDVSVVEEFVEVNDTSTFGVEGGGFLVEQKRAASSQGRYASQPGAGGARSSVTGSLLEQEQSEIIQKKEVEEKSGVLARVWKRVRAVFGY